MSAPWLDAAALEQWRPVSGQRLSQCAERGAVFACDALGQQHALVAGDAGADALLWLLQPGPVLAALEVEPEAFQQWLAQCAEHSSTLEDARAMTPDIAEAPASTAETLSLAQLDLAKSPVVRLVNAMLFDGMRGGASDVHVESTREGLTVKYRIDGVLLTAARVAGVQRAEETISRIKVMAELDISERRIPQDGRLQVLMEGRPVDVRVSIMPSIHGEDAVLRVLDRHHLTLQVKDLSLEALGFDFSLITGIERLARRPHGMLLVTGPTGSGKTTTLYAVINRTTVDSEKVVTIEDPVEYQLPGVLQIPVNERKGLTFARGLRSILRHDPDKILVGEIRDAETAQIAVQAALTGHLVFTTVHANDVFDVLGRFRQFGIDGYSLASAMGGILSQRLVRRRCQACATRAMDSLSSFGAACITCGGTGYRGRFALGELVTVDARMKSLISSGGDLEALRQAVAAQGAVGLRRQGQAAVDAGLTTLEELERVTSEA